MRRELVDRLSRALPVLKRDLVFEDIAGPMVELGVLFVSELSAIRACPSDVSRCIALVDVLAGKEDAAFGKFVDILRVDHFWLADEIQEPSALADVTDSVPVENPEHSVSSEQANAENRNCRVKRRLPEAVGGQVKRAALACNREGVPEDAQNLSQGVTEEMVQLVRRNHRTSRDWTTLAHALGLSRLVSKIRVKVLVYDEDLDSCVVHLLQEWMGLKPRDANLKNLVQVLRGEGFNDVADELVEKFAA